LLNLTLRNIVHKEDFSAQKDVSLRDVTELMNKNGKGVVVILDGKKIAGILTERDIVKCLYNGIDLDTNVTDFADKKLVTTKGDRTVGYALSLMIENNIRRIIITDGFLDEFIGVVTQQDLLKYLEEDFYRATIKVKHIIDRLGHLFNVEPDDSLKSVLDQMVGNQISAVAIISDGVAEGIISEKDILRLACENISLDSRVHEHMSTPVINVHLDNALVDIVTIMNELQINRVIVHDDSGIATNVITTRDVLKSLESDYSAFLERKLRSAKEILNLLPEMMVEIAETESDQLIVWANDKVTRKFGIDVLDQPVTEFLPREQWHKIYTTLRDSGKVENIKMKKGDSILELSGFYLNVDSNQNNGKIQLIIRDITDDIRLSTSDPLTGIYNRRFVNEYLIKEIARFKRSNESFSLVMCDIDNFKEINDTYGHLAGDIVLKSLAQLVTPTLRQLDIFGRYGGDEFVLVLPGTDSTFASNVIDRLRIKIESIPIALPAGVKKSITASFGVATFPMDGESSDDLLIKADERLYKAKSLGKNKVVFV
jgi:diguanylate cyclase (GGDEF)-like protein